VRLGLAKPAVSIRLGAPRQLFIVRQGVTSVRVVVFAAGVIVCRRQEGQSSGVRGRSKRWTVA
jgi:hypothetical protein